MRRGRVWSETHQGNALKMAMANDIPDFDLSKVTGGGLLCVCVFFWGGGGSRECRYVVQEGMEGREAWEQCEGPGCAGTGKRLDKGFGVGGG